MNWRLEFAGAVVVSAPQLTTSQLLVCERLCVVFIVVHPTETSTVAIGSLSRVHGVMVFNRIYRDVFYSVEYQ